MGKFKLWAMTLLLCLALGSQTVPAGQAATSGAADQVVTFETGKTPTNEIHVTTTGSDISGDGSLAQPYATVSRAVQAATPGTAVRIHPGTYTSRAWVEDVAGTAVAPIWIGGVPGQPKPVFTSDGEGLHLTRVRYVILHDIEVRHTLYNGINTDDGGDYDNSEATRYVVFRDLYIHDIGGSGNQDCLKLSGVYDYWVLNSEFARCGGSFSGSGIDHVGCHRGLIVGNYFHEMSGNAVQNKGGSEDIEIRANHMVDSGQRAVNIGGSTGFDYFRPPLSTTEPNFEARNIRVIANVIKGSVTPFAFVGAVDSIAAHNTIINPTNWLLRILQETTSTATYTFLESGNNQVINNIFYFDHSDLSTYINIGPNTAPETFTFAHNLWYAHDNPAQSQPTLPVSESNGLVGQDPLLASPATDNFQLLSHSPAIGSGQTLAGVTTDYRGYLYNVPPSIGAYEGNVPNLDERIYIPLVVSRATSP